jgi:hypothetical protein
MQKQYDKKVNLDSIEVQKLSEATVESDKLMKQRSNFNHKDKVSSTEKPLAECMRLIKTPEMEERRKTSTNVDEIFIEKELDSNNPDIETIDGLYDPIKKRHCLKSVRS